MSTCEYMWICFYSVSSTNCGISDGVSKCPIRFPSTAFLAANTFKMNWALSKFCKKIEENRVFLYTSLVSSGKNRHISRWFWFSPSHDPKIYWLWRYGLLLVWLIWHWWTHPSVIHPIPSNFYIPLLEIPPVLLLFEPVWIFTISWPIDKTRPAKLSQDLLPANLLVVGSCCSSEPTLKWNDHS